MKKKTIIGSIFAVLILLSMPIVSSLEGQQMTASVIKQDEKINKKITDSYSQYTKILDLPWWDIFGICNFLRGTYVNAKSAYELCLKSFLAADPAERIKMWPDLVHHHFLYMEAKVIYFSICGPEEELLTVSSDSDMVFETNKCPCKILG